MIKLKTIADSRGSLTVVERLPFEIKRAYWLHGIDTYATRGGHAHRQLFRLMVAVNGAFNVTIRDKQTYRTVELSDPCHGLLIYPMEWLELHSFTPDAVCLVFASLEHDEADCIRDFAEFKRLCR